MSSQVPTLAQVFLGFGGNTLFTIGTAFTVVGSIYGINRLTGAGISVINQVPHWLKSGSQKNDDKKNDNNNDDDKKNDNNNDDDKWISRKQVFDELSSYTKIAALIVGGVLVKHVGTKMGHEATISWFNSFLYK